MNATEKIKKKIVSVWNQRFSTGQMLLASYSKQMVALNITIYFNYLVVKLNEVSSFAINIWTVLSAA